jgi:hypothetical protein
MHGVPADLRLEPFVGPELNQIAIGRFQVQLHFAGTGSIYIEGRWELRDPTGAMVDAWQEHAQRECHRVHRVLDLPVRHFAVDAPRSFSLVFEPPFRLTVFDDTPEHEAFSIHVNGEPSAYF